MSMATRSGGFGFSAISNLQGAVEQLFALCVGQGIASLAGLLRPDGAARFLFALRRGWAFAVFHASLMAQRRRRVNSLRFLVVAQFELCSIKRTISSKAKTFFAPASRHKKLEAFESRGCKRFAQQNGRELNHDSFSRNWYRIAALFVRQRRRVRIPRKNFRHQIDF